LLLLLRWRLWLVGRNGAKEDGGVRWGGGEGK